MKKFRLAAIRGAVIALAGVGVANASITVGAPSVTGSSVYTWSYGITGDSFESLQPGSSYFTIYDFAGYVAGSVFAPTGWTATVQLIGQTPSGQLLPDNPSLFNLVFRYTGSGAVPVPTLSGFGAQSTLSIASGLNGVFSYLAFNNASAANDQGQGFVMVPTIPEPMTLTLLGGGLAILGLLRARRV